MMSYKFTMHQLFVNRLSRYLKYLFSGLPILIIVLFSFSYFSLCFAEPAKKSTASEKWVGTWSTAPQLVETNNNPPQPGLSNNTLRQIVHVSIGGDSLRMRFSNEFSASPVTMKEVHIAVSKGGSVIDTATDKVLYFNGNLAVTMDPRTAVMSDPFQFSLEPLSDVTITIYFGSTSPSVTGHPGSRTTSYILTGNEVLKENFSGAVTTDHWYVINTIDVKATDSTHAVAILGNSITDGRGSGTNKQDRWPDELALRLQENPATQHVAVLNEGIGGNAVLSGGLGPTALNRFQRDVIDQNGVKWLIILEGINDIGGSFGTGIAQNLINAYGQMIDIAHSNGIFVYGATLLPFGGSSYYSTNHETSRETVNEWIRNSGSFDAVIDLDKALRDPADTLRYLTEADDGDHLHPSETGHRLMAEAVDLNLFVGNDSLNYIDSSKTGVLNSNEAPNGFVLGQNYPNPFNPTTRISFSLPKESFVTIKVYDVLGKQIATLVNEEKPAGNYEIIFSAKGGSSSSGNAYSLSSGIYYYKLTAALNEGQTENFSEVKKMILMK